MTNNIPLGSRCAGHRTSGYWKGYPCGARPMHEVGGKYYCKNHLPLKVVENEIEQHQEE